MTETDTQKPAKKRREGVPKGGRGHAADPQTFWQRIQAIPEETWGNQYWMYLYRIKPVYDLKKSEGFSNLRKYMTCVDEPQIMKEFGSGEYKLTLNYKAPGAKNNVLVADQVFMVGPNPAYPPKLPYGGWVDDPRNKDWVWAHKRPDEDSIMGTPPKAPTQGNGEEPVLLQGMRLVKEIQKEVREEERDKTPTPAQPLDQFVGMMGLVKSFIPAPAPATDDKMLQAVVNLLTANAQAAQAAAAAAQVEAREARAQMLQLLIQKQEDKPSGIGSVKEILGEVKEFLPLIKDTFGLGDASGPRSRMSGWQEVFAQVFGNVANSPAMGAIAQALFMKMASPAPGAQAQGQQVLQPQVLPPNGPGAMPPPATALEAFQRRAAEIVPAMLKFFSQGLAGDDFAGWIIDGINDGETLVAAAKETTAPVIIDAFKKSPLWPQLSVREVQFTKFVNEFCGYKGDAEEEPIGVQDVDAQLEEL